MTRILTDAELAHLTIPRLQALLKASRVRAHAADPDYDMQIGAKIDYYERVKKELQRRQS